MQTEAVIHMHIALVDDERAELDILRTYLERFSAENGSNYDVDEFTSGDALLKDFQPIYDVIMFDIDMPGTNGINTARQVRLRDEDVIILFITNFAQYAIDAFEVGAAKYIIKPVKYFDFAMKFRRAVKRIVKHSDRVFLLETVEGKRRVQASDIVYVAALKHYLTYYLRDKNGETSEFEARGSIKEHEALLKPYHFCRTHKSYLVNMAWVDSIRSNEVRLAGTVIPIGRSYKKGLMEEYLRFVRG